MTEGHECDRRMRPGRNARVGSVGRADVLLDARPLVVHTIRWARSAWNTAAWSIARS